MKNEIIGFLSEAGHSISGYEHQLLEKFAAFLNKPAEPAPVVETPAPTEPAVVAHDPVAIEAPVVDTISTGNITNTEEK